MSAVEAEADLLAAVRVFEEAYAGLEEGPRTPDAATLAAAQAAVRGQAQWDPAALTRFLRDVLGAEDGHLAFGYGGHAPLRLLGGERRKPFVSAHVARVEADGAVWLGGERLSGCAFGAGGVEILPTLEGQFVLSVFAAEGAPAPVPCKRAGGGQASLPLRAAVMEAVPRRRGVAEAVTLERRGEVPVLSIRTFESAAAEALEGLPAMAGTLRESPGFVLDLRGNGGGNYRYAEAFLLALTSEPMQRLSEREVLSAAAAEGRANSARRRLGQGGVPAAAEARFVEHIGMLEALAAELRARGAGREDVVTPGEVVRGHAEGPLRGRAVLLVDGGCASACEMLVSLARQLPSTIVAGQPTRGGMAVGEVALFALPRSGIQVSFGTRAFRDALGDFEELRGFVPDVWIEGRDALAEAVALAAGSKTPAGEVDGRRARRAGRRGTSAAGRGAGLRTGRRPHAG
ncbi:S41 family peptidase [Chondromyces apiculatus]|uniref:S41 family peptidase n=1 Tax=Chondromyces apiculatus TaxID=51 RepID=UPI0018CC4A40|nr:S41 family peptidase [Chondromyces apiculatus]